MELLVLLLIPGVVIGLLLLGGWGYTVRAWKSEPCCAGCRYAVKGLVGTVCPECGGDLSGPGTRRPGDRRILRPPVWVAVVCRSVLLAGPAALIWKNAAEEYPMVISEARATAASQSDGWRIHIEGRGAAPGVRGYAWQTPVPRPGTRAKVTGPAGTSRLSVLDTRVRARYAGASGRVSTADGLSQHDVEDWLRAAGVQPTAAEAEAVHLAIRDVARGYGPRALLWGPFRVLGERSDRWTSPRPLAAAAVGVPALAVWGLLMWDLRRWRRPSVSRSRP